MRSIFDGYLTNECKNCPCWQDGSNGKGYGCGTPTKIDLCPTFKEMMKRYEINSDSANDIIG